MPGAIQMRQWSILREQSWRSNAVARIFVTSRVRATTPAAAPGALDPAAVLGAVKVKPSRARKVRDLDCPCARRLAERVGRDGRMGSARAEQKDGQKETAEGGH